MSTQAFLQSAWNWTPALLAAVALTAAYLTALRFKLSVRSLYFFAGVALMLLGLASPLNVLAEGYLFSAHMFQHMLLLMIVPLLMLLGLPTAGRMAKGGLGHNLGLYPALNWLAGIGTMWFWHVPQLCNAAVANPWVRGIQVASLVGMGLFFWTPILGSKLGSRLSPWSGIAYLFSACMGCVLLGIGLTFAPINVCSTFVDPVDHLGILSTIRNSWGMTPKLDQQIGGLIMWVPSCLMYLVGILSLLGRGFSAQDASETLESDLPLAAHSKTK
ncbi:MAG TPA: cytochrome c oxidase assembly protein [bacterium]|nr:cytochrome c oxidase assembly protein [bacterium]